MVKILQSHNIVCCIQASNLKKKMCIKFTVGRHIFHQMQKYRCGFKRKRSEVDVVTKPDIAKAQYTS